MKIFKTLLIITLCTTTLSVWGQIPRKNLKIVSYNVENYFDTVDDSIKIDEEYLPDGIRRWNNQKYQTKQRHIAKVLSALGGWDPPAIVGLYEIESEKAMRDLTKYSPLKNMHYKYIHYESPDARGIDVAMMYQDDLFEPIYHEAIPINFPFTSYKTRDILYVRGTVPSHDTLHLFFCHFPSRLGGELESEDRRMFVASQVREKVDSIFLENQKANIVIMGDFNDEPTNRSMAEVINAVAPKAPFASTTLYNLAIPFAKIGKGTHKFQGEWAMLDQIIVSGNLLNPQNGISMKPEKDTHIFKADFLMIRDERFLGEKPFRTYIGMKYKEGYSDHLPIYIDLWYK